MCIRDSAQALLSRYQGLIPQGYSVTDVSKYLYGSYSGIAVNIFNLVPSLTTTLGVSILPAVAGAFATRNLPEVKRNVESVLRVTAMVAIPAEMCIRDSREAINRAVAKNRMGALRPYDFAVIRKSWRQDERSPAL